MRLDERPTNLRRVDMLYGRMAPGASWALLWLALFFGSTVSHDPLILRFMARLFFCR